MSCAYVTIRYRLLWNGARSKPRGIPTNDDGDPAKDVALRLPATPRQIHAETRLPIFSLTTFKIPLFYQFRWVSNHALLQNIQSLCISNAGPWHLALIYRDSIGYQSFYRLPRSKIVYLTKTFPRLAHLELAPRNVDDFHWFDQLDPEDAGVRTMKGAKFFFFAAYWSSGYGSERVGLS